MGRKRRNKRRKQRSEGGPPDPAAPARPPAPSAAQPGASMAEPAPQQAPQAPPPVAERPFLLLLGGVLLAAVLVYLPTLGFDFVYDDTSVVLKNERIRAPDYPLQAFGEDVQKYRVAAPEGEEAGGQYYRPLVGIYLWACWQVFGDAPAGWHFLSVLLHALCTGLVGLLARRLGLSAGLAALSALAFGLHPIHAEVVSWVSSATDLVFGACALGALLAATWRGGPALAASLGLYLLACFSKETAYLLPPLFWLLLATLRRRGPALGWGDLLRAIPGTIPYGLIAIGVFALRLRVLGFLSRAVGDSRLGTGEALLALPRVLLEYVGMLVLGTPAGLAHGLAPPAGAGSPGFWLPLLILVALGCLLWRLRPLRPGEAALYGAGLLLPLVPILDLRLLPPDALVQDRYLFLSTAFACPALLLALSRRLPPRVRSSPQLVVGCLLVVLLAAGRSIYLSSAFADERTLFRRAIAVAPDNALFRSRYGQALFHAREFAASAEEMVAAARLRPDRYAHHVNAANALVRVGELAAAVEHQARVVELCEASGELAREPRLAVFLVAHADTLQKLERYQDARRVLSRTAELHPDHVPAWTALANLARTQGWLPDAERASRRMIALAPQDGAGHGSLGSTLLAQGRIGEAEVAFREAARLRPQAVEPQVCLARLYWQQNLRDEARAAARRAIAIQPTHPLVVELKHDLGLER